MVRTKRVILIFCNLILQQDLRCSVWYGIKRGFLKNPGFHANKKYTIYYYPRNINSKLLQYSFFKGDCKYFLKTHILNLFHKFFTEREMVLYFMIIAKRPALSFYLLSEKYLAKIIVDFVDPDAAEVENCYYLLVLSQKSSSVLIFNDFANRDYSLSWFC